MSEPLRWFRCDTCHQNHLDGILEKPPTCSKCLSLKSDSRSSRHSLMIRCPKCRHIEEAVPDFDYAGLYEEGGHDVTCVACGHGYRIVTHVSYEFESPDPLAKTECQGCGVSTFYPHTRVCFEKRGRM